MAVAQNLSGYMNKARTYAKDHPNTDPAKILPDGRFYHIVQVQKPLRFLRACKGKIVNLSERFPNQGRQVDDVKIWSQTNDTIGAVRSHILHRVKANSNVKVDLYVNGEILKPSEDKRLISQIPLLDNMIMSNSKRYARFLFQLSDLGCSLQVPKLSDTAGILLKLMPEDAYTKDTFRSQCIDQVRSGTTGVSQLLDEMFFNSSPTQVLYNFEVAYRLLMSVLDPMADDAFYTQYNIIRSGGVQLAHNMLI